MSSFISAILLLTGLNAQADQIDSNILRVPAYTAYFEPDFSPSGSKLTVEKGISNWGKPDVHVVWYGYLSNTGTLSLGVSLQLPLKATSGLSLRVAKQEQDAAVDDFGKGGNSLDAKARGAGDAAVAVDFGSVKIASQGVYRFVLTGRSKSGALFGDLNELILSGPAAAGAHFSMDKSRVAPSVHLWYQTPKGSKVAWFYNEITPLADPIHTYYMVCGFTGGYFGIQVNSDKERTILFSVWNAGKEEKDPDKVASEDKVQLVANGDGVKSREFGSEGTGGHSSMTYMWKTGQTYRLLVSARPESGNTVYSGFFYFPEKRAWALIASWRKPKDGDWLRGLYSFNEDFIQANGFQKRLARFANQWIRTDEGKWMELTTAEFTHTHRTGDRLDRGGGLLDGGFYLMNGGFLRQFNDVKYGDIFTRPATAKIPVDNLPALPTPRN
jgi:hypothetical protein